MITVKVDRDLEDLIPGFLANRHRDTEKIHDALAVGDFDTIRILGHSMKGSGGGYGFDAITEIGARIEQAAQAGDSEGVRSANETLRDYLRQVKVDYR